MDNSSPPLVSLCMIVRNEEQNLARCLATVQDLAQEIVIVDTGSTDRTREIAEKFGARVIEMTWCDDFSAARNMFMEHATGKWIMWMDADDVLPADQHEPLQQLLSSLGDAPCAYHFWVNSPEGNENSVANSLTQIRLFRADSRLRWTRRVHEQISPACEKLGYPEVFTEIRIQHLGYRDPALMQRKINRDLRLLRMEYATNPQEPGTLLYLGLNLMKTGKHAEALSYLMQAYQVTQNASQQYVAVILSLLVDCLIRNGQMEHALTISTEAMRRFPKDLGISVQHAQLLFHQRQNTMAINVLRDCLSRPPVRETFFGSQGLLNGREIKMLLARIYTDEQNFRDAERLYQELIADQPTDEHLWGYLGALYLTEKRLGDVEYAIRQVDKCPRGKGVAEVLRAAIKLEQNNLSAARQHCEAAILHQPDSCWARALLCQILYLQQDPDGQLQNALRDLLRYDPLNKMAATMLQEVKQLQQLRESQWSMNVNM